MIIIGQYWIDVLREVGFLSVFKTFFQIVIEQKENGPLSLTLCRLAEHREYVLSFYAISIIRTLLSDMRFMPCVNALRKSARQTNLLHRLLERIRETMTKDEHVQYYVDVLRILIKGHNSLKVKGFMTFHGLLFNLPLQFLPFLLYPILPYCIKTIGLMHNFRRFMYV